MKLMTLCAARDFCFRWAKVVYDFCFHLKRGRTWRFAWFKAKNNFKL